MEAKEWDTLYMKEEEDVTAKLIEMKKTKLMYVETHKIGDNNNEELEDEIKRKDFVKDLDRFMKDALTTTTIFDKLNPFKKQNSLSKPLLRL